MNLVLALSLAVSGLASWSGWGSVVTCYFPPVVAAVVAPFDEPACTYCAGHRGIEYAVADRTTIRSAAAGVVTFAGSVAGTAYVVVDHDDGLTATYGKLRDVGVVVGQRVATGDPVGSSGLRVYFGLRRDDRYLDPQPLLGTIGRHARLVPIDATRGRRAPPPVLTCPRNPGRTASASGPRSR